MMVQCITDLICNFAKLIHGYIALSNICLLYTSEKLDLLDRVCPKIDVADLERFIELAETENGITYAKAQRKAIVNVLTSGVMVLTGGPGTGKTTVTVSYTHLYVIHIHPIFCLYAEYN